MTYSGKLRSLAVMLMAVLMVSSVATAPLIGTAFLGDSDRTHDSGIAAAQEDKTFGDRVCENRLAWMMASPYCVITSLFDSPDEVDNSVELEEGAYVQHGQIADTHHSMVENFEQHFDDTQSIAFADGEQALIESRYNDDDISTARYEARSATNEYYAQDQYAGMINAHNDTWTEWYTWSQATNEDENADTVLDFYAARADTTTYTYYDEITVSADSDTELVRDDYVLPSGEEIEYISRLKNVHVEDLESDSNTEGFVDAERVDMEFNLDDESGDAYITWYAYENADDDEPVDNATLTAYNEIRGHDPNSEDTDTIGLIDRGENNTVYSLINEYETQRSETLNLVEDRAEEVYNEVDAGELSPDEYFGPREFYTEYGSAMGTNYAAELYFHQTIGASAAPDMQMDVEYNDETYQGGVLTDNPDGTPLVYDEDPLPLSSNGDVELSSHNHQDLLEFNEDGQAVIEFADNSDYDTGNINVDLINVDDADVSYDGTTISAEFNEADLQDEAFVIFETSVEDGESVETSDTYVLFTNEDTTEVRGWVVGETYSGDSAWMIYQSSEEQTDDLIFDGEWTLTANYNSEGDEKAVAVAHEGVDMSYSGTSTWDRIDQQQTIKDAISERDDITTATVDDGWGLLEGLLIGVVVMIVIGLVLAFLVAIGRITSVA